MTLKDIERTVKYDQAETGICESAAYVKDYNLWQSLYRLHKSQ